MKVVVEESQGMVFHSILCPYTSERYWGHQESSGPGGAHILVRCIQQHPFFHIMVLAFFLGHFVAFS